MTDIEKIVAYIAQSDPYFPGKIRGAAADKITALENAAGTKLRTVYRDFLRVMGESMGWLQPYRAKFGIDDMLASYSSESWRPPQGYFRFGLATEDPFFDLYLEQGNVSQPRVVTMPQHPAANFDATKKSFRNPVAGSLPEFLGTSVFRKARIGALPASLRIAGNETKEPLLDQVPAALEQHGFQPLWFSNDWVQVLEAPGGAAVATQVPRTVLAIDIAAWDEGILSKIADELRAKFHLSHTFQRRSSMQMGGV